jgi:hypothetical protein
MVQPNYSPEEALQRIKLMMEYDSSKTLDENKKVILEQKTQVDEALPGVLGTAAGFLTAASTWWMAPLGAATVPIAMWLYDSINNGLPTAAKVQSFFNSCSSQKLKPSTADAALISAAESINTAIEGFGTDEDAIKTAISSMKNVADLCALKQKYDSRYGDLYEDLDGDIDGTDWKTYVWAPMQTIIEKSAAELEKAQEKSGGGKSGGGKSGGGSGSKYKPCSGTYSFGCKSEAIAKVQSCLGGLTVDGKFGSNTKKKLAAKGFTSFTDADVDKICKKITTVEDPLLSVPDSFGDLQANISPNTTNNPKDNTGPVDGYTLI